MSEVGVTSKATALATARSRQSRPNTYSVDLTRNRPPMKCTKCGLDNHIIKGCYEIIGYPEGWVHKGRKKDSTRASFASTQSSEETASEPPSGTSGSKALATSGTPKLSELGARAIPGWVTHWEVACELPETKPCGQRGGPKADNIVLRRSRSRKVTICRKVKSPPNSSYFYQYVATQFDKKITTLRSDNKGGYVNHDLHTFLSQHGIVHQTTCAYTPQQNGVAERKNRHLLEVVRASLFEDCMPHHFWGEALCSAAYLINRTPSSTLQYQTPFQTLTTLFPMSSTPNLEPRLFGCVAYAQVYPHQRGKLDPCALRCVFVGYAATQKGYKCFHPPTQTMHVTADVTFHESEFYYSGGVSEHPLQGESSIFAEDTQSIQIQQTVLEQSVSEQPATSSATRSRVTGNSR
ncbi:hypothetical protein L3X38_033862 [Prunus dulcis]|uniref:Integrase catalytic domain-containing protein n=1 Tax=Prunus dulcis TaxID=3755 RepID=A0AAD4YXB9_PRUDU|nr:hypothetical protein L3X38_033862 [Prunus dulcis]